MRTLVTRLVKNHLTFDTGAICFLFLFIEVNTQSLEDFSKKLSIQNVSDSLAKTAELRLDRSADGAGHADKGLPRQEKARRRSDRKPSRSLVLIPQVICSERRTLLWLGFRSLITANSIWSCCNQNQTCSLLSFSQVSCSGGCSQAYISLRKLINKS